VGPYSAGVLPGVDVRRLSGTQAFAPDPVLRSLVSARVAQLCLCEFCIDITNMKLAERSGGSAKLLAVAEWRNSALFSDRERLALEYAEAASMTPVDDALRGRLAGAFDARAHRTHGADRLTKPVGAL
jgi:alkylhydroperoxidase family enzyme